MSKKVELAVGFFVALTIAALLLLALRVANQGTEGTGETYQLYAKFDNIGGLKVRSAVKVGGVVVGRVTNIRLDEDDFSPIVEMDIAQEFNQFPETSSASILTSGLLGEQYVGLVPGFSLDDTGILGNGDRVEDTKSALVLEDLIGQFLFNQGSDK